MAGAFTHEATFESYEVAAARRELNAEVASGARVWPDDSEVNIAFAAKMRDLATAAERDGRVL